MAPHLHCLQWEDDTYTISNFHSFASLWWKVSCQSISAANTFICNTSYRPKLQLKPLYSVQLSNRFIRGLEQTCYKASGKELREGSLHLHAKPALKKGTWINYVWWESERDIYRQPSVLKPRWRLRWHPTPSICIVIESGSHFSYQGPSPCLILNHEQQRKVITQANYLFSIWSFFFFFSFSLFCHLARSVRQPESHILSSCMCINSMETM